MSEDGSEPERVILSQSVYVRPMDSKLRAASASQERLSTSLSPSSYTRPLSSLQLSTSRLQGDLSSESEVESVVLLSDISSDSLDLLAFSGQSDDEDPSRTETEGEEQDVSSSEIFLNKVSHDVVDVVNEALNTSRMMRSPQQQRALQPVSTPRSSSASYSLSNNLLDPLATVSSPRRRKSPEKKSRQEKHKRLAEQGAVQRLYNHQLTASIDELRETCAHLAAENSRLMNVADLTDVQQSSQDDTIRQLRRELAAAQKNSKTQMMMLTDENARYVHARSIIVEKEREMAAMQELHEEAERARDERLAIAAKSVRQESIHRERELLQQLDKREEEVQGLLTELQAHEKDFAKLEDEIVRLKKERNEDDVRLHAASKYAAVNMHHFFKAPNNPGYVHFGWVKARILTFITFIADQQQVLRGLLRRKEQSAEFSKAEYALLDKADQVRFVQELHETDISDLTKILKLAKTQFAELKDADVNLSDCEASDLHVGKVSNEAARLRTVLKQTQNTCLTQMYKRRKAETCMFLCKVFVGWRQFTTAKKQALLRMKVTLSQSRKLSLYSACLKWKEFVIQQQDHAKLEHEKMETKYRGLEHEKRALQELQVATLKQQLIKAKRAAIKHRLFGFGQERKEQLRKYFERWSRFSHSTKHTRHALQLQEETDQMAETHRRERIATMARRWQFGIATRLFTHWKVVSRTQRQKKRKALGSMIQHSTHAVILHAWRRMEFHVDVEIQKEAHQAKTAKMQMKAASTMLIKSHTSLLVRCFFRWHEFSSRQSDRRAQLTRKYVMRLCNDNLWHSWKRLHEFVYNCRQSEMMQRRQDEEIAYQKRVDNIQRKAAATLLTKSHTSLIVRCFFRWHEFSTRQSERRAQLTRKYLMRLCNDNLWHSWKRLQDHVKESQKQEMAQQRRDSLARMQALKEAAATQLLEVEQKAAAMQSAMEKSAIDMRNTNEQQLLTMKKKAAEMLLMKSHTSLTVPYFYRWKRYTEVNNTRRVDLMHKYLVRLCDDNLWHSWRKWFDHVAAERFNEFDRERRNSIMSVASQKDHVENQLAEMKRKAADMLLMRARVSSLVPLFYRWKRFAESTRNRRHHLTHKYLMRLCNDNLWHSWGQWRDYISMSRVFEVEQSRRGSIAHMAEDLERFQVHAQSQLNAQQKESDKIRHDAAAKILAKLVKVDVKLIFAQWRVVARASVDKRRSATAKLLQQTYYAAVRRAWVHWDGFVQQQHVHELQAHMSMSQLRSVNTMMQRLQRQNLKGFFGRWTMFVAQTKLDRQKEHRAALILNKLRVKNIKTLFVEWRRWATSNMENKQALTKSILLRMVNGALWRSWRKWTHHVDQAALEEAQLRRLAERERFWQIHETHLAQKRLRSIFGSWRHLQQEVMMKRLISRIGVLQQGKVQLFTKHGDTRTLASCFHKLVAFTKRSRKERKAVLIRYVHRMSHAKLYQAWRSWTVAVEASKVQDMQSDMDDKRYEQAEAILKQWRLRSVVQAFHTWKVTAANQRALKHKVLKRFIARAWHGRVREAYRIWADWYLNTQAYSLRLEVEKRKNKQLEKVFRLNGIQVAASVFRAWRKVTQRAFTEREVLAHMDQLRSQRAVFAQGSMRLFDKRTMQSAFLTWKHAAHAQMTVKRLFLGRILRSSARMGVARSWQRWNMATLDAQHDTHMSNLHNNANRQRVIMLLLSKFHQSRLMRSFRHWNDYVRTRVARGQFEQRCVETSTILSGLGRLAKKYSELMLSYQFDTAGRKLETAPGKVLSLEVQCSSKLNDPLLHHGTRFLLVVTGHSSVSMRPSLGDPSLSAIHADISAINETLLHEPDEDPEGLFIAEMEWRGVTHNFTTSCTHAYSAHNLLFQSLKFTLCEVVEAEDETLRGLFMDEKEEQTSTDNKRVLCSTALPLSDVVEWDGQVELYLTSAHANTELSSNAPVYAGIRGDLTMQDSFINFDMNMDSMDSFHAPAANRSQAYDPRRRTLTNSLALHAQLPSERLYNKKELNRRVRSKFAHLKEIYRQLHDVMKHSSSLLAKYVHGNRTLELQLQRALAQVNETNEQVTKLDKTVDNLVFEKNFSPVKRDKSALLSREVQELAQLLDEAKAREQVLHEDYKRINATKADQMVQLESRIAKLSENKFMLERKIQELSTTLSTKENENHACNLDAQSLSKEIDELRREIAAGVDDAHRMKKEKAELQRQLQNSQQLVEAVQDEKKTNATLLAQQQATMRSNIEALEAALAKLRKEKEHDEARHAVDVEEYQGQLRQCEETIEMQEASVRELALKLRKMRKEHEIASRDAEANLELARKLHQQEMDSLESRYKAKLSQAGTTQDRASEEAELKLKEVREQLDAALEQEEDKAQRAAEKHTQELARLEQQYKKAEDELRNEVLKADEKLLTAQKHSEERRVQHLSDLDRIAEKLSVSEKRQEELSAMVIAAENNLAESEVAMKTSEAKLKRDLEQMERRMEISQQTASEKIADLEVDVQRLENELTSKRSMLHELNTSLNDLNTSDADLQDELSRVQDEKQDVEERMQRLRQQLKTCQNLLTQARDEAAQKVEAAEARLRDLQLEAVQTKRQLEAESAELLAAATNEAADKLAFVELQLQAATQRASDLERDAKKNTEEMLARVRIEHNEAMTALHVKHAQELVDVRSQQSSLLEDKLHALRLEHERQLMELRAQHDARMTEIESELRHNADMQIARAHAEKEALALELEDKNGQNTLQSAEEKRRWTEERNALNVSLQNVSTDHDNAVREVDMLKSDLKRVTTMLSDVKALSAASLADEVTRADRLAKQNSLLQERLAAEAARYKAELEALEMKKLQAEVQSSAEQDRLRAEVERLKQSTMSKNASAVSDSDDLAHELEAAEQRHDQFVRDMKKDHRNALLDMQATHRENVKKVEQEYEDALERARVRHNTDIAELKTSHDNAMETVKNFYLEQIKSLEAQLKGSLNGDRRNAALIADRDNAVKDCEAARQQVADLRAEMEQLAAKHNELEQQYVRDVAALKQQPELTATTEVSDSKKDGEDVPSPVDTARNLLRIQALFVGIEIVELKGANAGRGVKVVMVDGPAEKAGLRVGDVIRKLNNKRITDHNSCTTLFGEALPGDTLSFVVQRQRELLNLSVKTESTSNLHEDLMKLRKIASGMQVDHVERVLFICMRRIKARLASTLRKQLS